MTMPKRGDIYVKNRQDLDHSKSIGIRWPGRGGYGKAGDYILVTRVERPFFMDAPRLTGGTVYCILNGKFRTIKLKYFNNSYRMYSKLNDET